MTPEPDDARLDDLLRGWASANSVSEPSIQTLAARISPGHAASHSTPPRSGRLVLSLTVACLILVACLTVPPVRQAEDPVERLRLQTHLASLWNEADRLFDGELSWICDLDGELLLGMDPERKASEAEPVCLSLRVRRYDAHAGAWTIVWSGNIRCRAGDSVDFAAADHRAAGSLWIQSRPDGGYAISHWLSFEEFPELSGAVETMVPAGTSRVVADQQRPDGQRYQIVQQVWRPELG